MEEGGGPVIYTLERVSDCGNFAGETFRRDCLRTARSRREVADVLAEWADTVGRYSDKRNASLIVYSGRIQPDGEPLGAAADDIYPTWQVTLGTRGGAVWTEC
jgi:hypothetical protein